MVVKSKTKRTTNRNATTTRTPIAKKGGKEPKAPAMPSRPPAGTKPKGGKRGC